MSYVATSQLVARWLRARVTPQRVIELTALLVMTTALAAVAIPLWLLLAYRPDRDHPVNRLLEACQEGVRRGSLAVLGLTAGLVLLACGVVVVGGLRDLRAMRRFGRALADSKESSVCAGGVKTKVLLLADRVAFTAGLFRPRIYLGAGLVAALRPKETEAVVLHEQHHLARYDPLRCWLVELALALPMFKPGRSLAVYYRASREAEADRAAVEWQGDDRPLLTALSKADALQTIAGACGLSAGRQHALRQVRHLDAKVSQSDRLAVAFALSVVGALLLLTVAGLSDWQWYWFCPTAMA